MEDWVCEEMSKRTVSLSIGCDCPTLIDNFKTGLSVNNKLSGLVYFCSISFIILVNWGLPVNANMECGGERRQGGLFSR